jgi:hypothetical protein
MNITKEDMRNLADNRRINKEYNEFTKKFKMPNISMQLSQTKRLIKIVVLRLKRSSKA